MTNKPRIPQFRIGFTFRGSQKDIVEVTCEALLNRGYAKSDIFYYPWHQALIGGVGSAGIHQDIYHDRCDYVVVLLSPDYAEGTGRETTSGGRCGTSSTRAARTGSACCPWET